MRQTKVRELMTREVITLEKEQSMPTAEELLRLLRIRHLPVVDREGKLVGLVTHRRLLQEHVNLLAQAKGHDEEDPEEKIPVSRVMESRVHTVSPDMDAAEALELMLDKVVGCLPVVEERRIVGIVSSQDFLRFQLRKLRAEARREEREAEDDTETVPDGPPAAVGKPEQEDDTLGPQPAPAAPATAPRRPGARRLMVGVALLGVGLAAGLLVARVDRGSPERGEQVDGYLAPGSAPVPPGADARPPDVSGQDVPRSSGAPAVDAPPGPPRRARPARLSRPRTPPLDVGPDLRRPADLRPRPRDGGRARPVPPGGWIPEKIHR